MNSGPDKQPGSMTPSDVMRILLVEDNPGDVRLTRESLKITAVRNELRVVGDGVEALAYLRQQMDDGGQLPHLILLDLNLPKKSGLEVLAELKEDARLKHIPALVLSSSEAETDRLRAYQLHANCYLTKPADFRGYQRIVEQVESFWLQVVTLPPVKSENVTLESI